MSAERADRLTALVAERELDALAVTAPANLRWLTGFDGTNGAALVGADERTFLTDFRYLDRAAEEVHGFEVVRGERDLLADLAGRLRGRVGFDDAQLSVRAWRTLSDAAPAGVELVAAGGLVERLRERKDEGELRAIAAAAALADEALDELLAQGLAGRTELEVARALEAAMRARGAEPSFPAIVAAGENGARPHAEPRPVEIPRGALVVVDFGARLDGLCSDCTRTLAAGAPDEHAVEVYELVRRAQAEALAAARAGAELQAVDGAARSIIEAAGFGDCFGHGLGHGVGLEVHEGPRLAKSADGQLAAGNVVTIEPGVYLTGELGVRIEDLVVVHDGDPEVLTRFPKSLVEVG